MASWLAAGRRRVESPRIIDGKLDSESTRAIQPAQCGYYAAASSQVNSTTTPLAPRARVSYIFADGFPVPGRGRPGRIGPGGARDRAVAPDGARRQLPGGGRGGRRAGIALFGGRFAVPALRAGAGVYRRAAGTPGQDFAGQRLAVRRHAVF